MVRSGGSRRHGLVPCDRAGVIGRPSPLGHPARRQTCGSSFIAPRVNAFHTVQSLNPASASLERRATRRTGQLAPIDSRAMALIAARAALEKHAEDVTVMDLRSLSTVTDCFVICTGGSVRQLKALKEHIEQALSQQGHRVWHVEGITSNTGPPGAMAPAPHWVLMDCGDVVVHLLDARARELYQLERLWADAPRIPLTANA